MWDGFIYPVTRDAVTPPPPYSWADCCPFCGGEIRLGIRQQLPNAIDPPSNWQADGEGEE